MSAVLGPAMMKRTTGRPSCRVSRDRDGPRVPRDVLDHAGGACRGAHDVRSHKLARFSRDARELQSPPPYLPAPAGLLSRSTYADRWRHARVRKREKKRKSNRNPAARVRNSPRETRTRRKRFDDDGRATPIAMSRATRSACLARVHSRRCSPGGHESRISDMRSRGLVARGHYRRRGAAILHVFSIDDRPRDRALAISAFSRAQAASTSILSATRNRVDLVPLSHSTSLSRETTRANCELAVPATPVAPSALPRFESPCAGLDSIGNCSKNFNIGRAKVIILPR